MTKRAQLMRSFRGCPAECIGRTMQEFAIERERKKESFLFPSRRILTYSVKCSFRKCPFRKWTVGKIHSPSSLAHFLSCMQAQPILFFNFRKAACSKLCFLKLTHYLPDINRIRRYQYQYQYQSENLLFLSLHVLQTPLTCEL